MQSFKEYFYQTLMEEEEYQDMSRNIIDGPNNKESVEHFIERHQLNFDGTYIKMYHAMPKRTKFNGILREWSKFEKNPEKARFFAARDRDLDENKDIKLFLVSLLPNEIEWTGFVQNNRPIPSSRIKLIKDNFI